jgi:two-component system, sensor histidine kinase
VCNWAFAREVQSSMAASEQTTGDILVVDDNPANLLAMESALGDLGGKVVRARSGEEALRVLLEHDFAVILMDVQMPSMDGFDTAKLIRERRRSRYTPIIFITAHGRDEQDVVAAYKLGAVDFLFKPVAPEVLQAKASVFVELHRRTLDVARQAELLRELEGREREREFEEERRRWNDEVVQRQMRELAETNRRKDEFLAMLGHELRNPLAAILAGSTLLGQKILTTSGLDPAFHRAQSRINHQVEHLRRLVDDLLDVARINSGKVELTKKHAILQVIVDNAVAICRPVLDERGHSLSIGLPEAPIVLWADEVRLTQVLANLLNNAARYTNEGGDIRIHGRREGDALELAVTDNGRGIGADVLPHVFDAFVQETGGAGLGLGLTLVKRLVDMHDGVVTASSEGLGRGSTFTVRLPVEDRAPEALPDAPSAPAPSKPGGPLAIVLVEDNEDLRELLRDVLSVLGHTVDYAEDGEKGAELILKIEPDVALVDVGLPKLNGYQVAERVRRLAGSKRTRLVAMTGFGREADQVRSRAAGFDAYIVKPVDIDALAQILHADS